MRISDKSGRTHDAHGNRYSKTQKRFNDAEETIAEVVLGKCSLFCGDVLCRASCQNPGR